MIGIVIVAHGGLAAAYLDAMQHVVGAQPGVASVSISEADALAVKRQEIGAAIAAVDAGAGVIVVTDLFGGSPSNLAVAACSRADRRVLYGANMPMLIKLAKSRAMPLDQAVERALRAGRRYIDALQPVLPAAE